MPSITSPSMVSCTGLSGPCTGTILQPRLHVAMALIPTPSFELAQTRTVGAHGCWDYLAGVPASSNVGFALGEPRNGRARPKNGRGENSENSENRQATPARLQVLLGRCSRCSSPRRAERTYRG